MLIIALTVLFVLVCFLLVVVILLQTGKGGGISSAFGIGQAGQTLFGASGAGNVLTKATAVLGGTFMVISLLLAMIEKSSGPSVGRKSILQEGLGSGPISAPAGNPDIPGEMAAPASGGASAPVTVTPSTNPGSPITTPGTVPGAATSTGN